MMACACACEREREPACRQSEPFGSGVQMGVWIARKCTGVRHAPTYRVRTWHGVPWPHQSSWPAIEAARASAAATKSSNGPAALATPTKATAATSSDHQSRTEGGPRLGAAPRAIVETGRR